MKTKRISRKKNYIAVVNGALWRNLIGKNVKTFELIKKNEKNFYFFSNAKSEHNPESILENVLNYANDMNKNFCFGVFVMKNNKEYYFICEIDTLYITSENTCIHSRPNILLTKKKD